MTKFQRAKQQTLKRWECRLDRALGIIESYSESCGFCGEYARLDDPDCLACPVKKHNGLSCPEGTWYNYTGGVDDIPAILATLTFIHSMNKTVNPKTRGAP